LLDLPRSLLFEMHLAAWHSQSNQAPNQPIALSL
jgi:hypothetical protein